MDRWTLLCDLVCRGFHPDIFSTVTKVFQHASSLNLFRDGAFGTTVSKVCAVPKNVTDETALSTFALTDSRR
jgi:hypothetical protein